MLMCEQLLQDDAGISRPGGLQTRQVGMSPVRCAESQLEGKLQSANLSPKRRKVGAGLAISRPWPNNPVELTAHSEGFWGYCWLFLLWAAAHRQR
jgi:hypothetical protein